MLENAAKHFELVLEGYTKLFGPEHPETIALSDRLKRCKAVQVTLMRIMMTGDNGGTDGGDENDTSGNRDGDD